MSRQMHFIYRMFELTVSLLPRFVSFLPLWLVQFMFLTFGQSKKKKIMYGLFCNGINYFGMVITAVAMMMMVCDKLWRNVVF